MSFLKELKRRNVFRVGIAYLVMTWLLMQVTTTFAPVLYLPGWMSTAVAFLLIVGFPVALFFAWAFELTPEGLRREQEVEPAEYVRGKTGRRLDLIIIAVLSAALVVFALDKFVWDNSSREEAKGVPTEIRRSIAVLPFENMSGKESNNPFTIGIHDDLLTHLSRITSIRVISRTSVLQYRETSKPISEIATELNVATVLEGGVQRSGDRIRINVQLIDASSDEHLWAETYDRQLTTVNIFAIQTEIATKIAAALRTTLTPQEHQNIAVVPTDSLAAYEAYQLGKQALARRTTVSIAEATDLFTQATAFDPEFAQAWAALADSYHLMASLTGQNVDELNQKARKAVEQALGLNDQLSESQTALAEVLRRKGDLPGAEQAIKRALELNPNNARAHADYAWLLHGTGSLEQSLQEHEKAVRLDPLSARINDGYAFTLAEVGRFDEALSRYRKVDEIDPAYPGAANSIGTIYGLAYGRLDVANAWYRKALSLDAGNPWFSAILGLVFLELNDDDSAEFWINRALHQAPRHPWANGAMVMLQSYRGNSRLLRQHAENVLEISPRWRFGTVLSHGRVPDLRNGRYEDVLNRYELSFPELFRAEPEVSSGTYRPAIDVAGVLLLSGQDQRAFALLAQCQQQVSARIRVGYFGYWVSDVQILALQGKTDEALLALRQAVDQGWRADWRYFFYIDPNLDSIREEPQFQAILSEIEVDMAAQLERTREMETNGEVVAMPTGRP